MTDMRDDWVSYRATSYQTDEGLGDSLMLFVLKDMIDQKYGNRAEANKQC